MKVVSLITLVCLLGQTLGTAPPMARVDDFKVYRVLVQDDDQLKEFKALGDNLPLHYLTDIGGAGRSYDVVIEPANQQDFEERLRHYEMPYEITISNLQELIEKRIPSLLNPGMEWTQYHSLKDIYEWLVHLVFRHPFVVTPYVIGYSYEGRPIKAIKISRKPGNKAIFIEANIHAIEWISSAAGTCFINNLLTSNDNNIRHLAVNYDWIFVPVLNPDGFEYTHNVAPLWRKNRKPTGFSNSSGICYGTDLNRNFNYQWKVAGYNMDVPCDHWYAGPEPAKEPEVQALVNFVNSFPQDYIRMYLALHSYGNFLLLPYGHTNEEFPSNYQQMLRISKGFADAARVKYGTDFLYGASGLLNYPVSGSAKDWAYAVKGIPYTATVELRDRGTYGFFLPAKQIIEVCEEITDGFVGLVKAAEEEGLFD